jgi:hypothetical protein
MACAPCAAAAAAFAAGNQSRDMRGTSTVSSTELHQPCGINGDMLQSWKAIMKCIKLKHKESLIGMATATVNQIAGIIQSAINYPDNYCYYYPQLEYFQSAVLPQIITNVPECVNQS